MKTTRIGDSLLYTGNALHALRQMKDNSVHLCVTSPPYYGMRAYGTDPQIWTVREECKHVWEPLRQRAMGRTSHGSGKSTLQGGSSPIRPSGMGEVCKHCNGWKGELGSEPTFEMFMLHLVRIFREVRRVLRPDGTLWMNYGAKPKKNLGTPHRLAMALQNDGWFWADEIIWQSLSKMPESVRDRTSCQHEYIFMFGKTKNYFYDFLAIRERSKSVPHSPGMKKGIGTDDHKRADQDGSRSAAVWASDGFSLKRSVWTVNPQGTSFKHFAGYPKKLILPCIKAGTSKFGCCADCGTPYERIIESQRKATRPGTKTKVSTKNRRRIQLGLDSSSTTLASVVGNRDPLRHVTSSKTIGWKKACRCKTKKRVPAIVLDPFGGTGTSAVAAIENGRHAVLCELNPEYAAECKRRMKLATERRGFGL